MSKIVYTTTYEVSRAHGLIIVIGPDWTTARKTGTPPTQPNDLPPQRRDACISAECFERGEEPWDYWTLDSLCDAIRAEADKRGWVLKTGARINGAWQASWDIAREHLRVTKGRGNIWFDIGAEPNVVVPEEAR